MTIDWIKADWPAPASIHAGTTLRCGGVSVNNWASLNLGEHVNDDAIAVAENRQRFLLECDLPSEPRWLRQTHSCNVALGAPLNPDAGTDAIATVETNSVCAVLTADCLPVVFATRKSDEIAVAHAGWRGLCNGVLEATVNAMNCKPADILVWLGPAISQPAFEVGVEVREQFIAGHADAGELVVTGDVGAVTGRQVAAQNRKGAAVELRAGQPVERDSAGNAIGRKVNEADGRGSDRERRRKIRNDIWVVVAVPVSRIADARQ